MQVNHLFVYGSLMSGFRSHAYEYISRFFKLLGEASVTGTMYDMGSFPVATAANTGRIIKGELYAINNPAEFSYAISQLDDYEGLYPEEGEPVLYRREVVEAAFNGETINVWVYWYNQSIADKPIYEPGDMNEYAKTRR